MTGDLATLVELLLVAGFNVFAFWQASGHPWRGVALIMLCIPINLMYGLSYADTYTAGSARWVEGYIIGIPLSCIYFGTVIYFLMFGRRSKK